MLVQYILASWDELAIDTKRNVAQSFISRIVITTIGKRNFHISPKPIRDEEKYEDYLARLERDGEKANRTSGNRWTNGELEVLEELLARRATQLELAAALPVRSWEAIRKKIVQLRGDSSMVTATGQMEDGERISDYLKRCPEAAAAMEFSFLDYSSRRKSKKKPSHQPLTSARASPTSRLG